MFQRRYLFGSDANSRINHERLISHRSRNQAQIEILGRIACGTKGKLADCTVRHTQLNKVAKNIVLSGTIRLTGAPF